MAGVVVDTRRRDDMECVGRCVHPGFPDTTPIQEYNVTQTRVFLSCSTRNSIGALANLTPHPSSRAISSETLSGTLYSTSILTPKRKGEREFSAHSHTHPQGAIRKIGDFRRL